jgi:hypothetical protein
LYSNFLSLYQIFSKTTIVANGRPRNIKAILHLEGGSAYVDSSSNTSTIISPPPAMKSDANVKY